MKPATSRLLPLLSGLIMMPQRSRQISYKSILEPYFCKFLNFLLELDSYVCSIVRQNGGGGICQRQEKQIQQLFNKLLWITQRKLFKSHPPQFTNPGQLLIVSGLFYALCLLVGRHNPQLFFCAPPNGLLVTFLSFSYLFVPPKRSKYNSLSLNKEII